MPSGNVDSMSEYCVKLKQTREDMVVNAMRKFHLRVGKLFRLRIRLGNSSEGVTVKIKKAYLIYMGPYFMTFEDAKVPSLKYTMYYHDIGEYIC